MANAIVHFEIPADDVQRAKSFYSKIFGWKISDPWKMDYFMVVTRKEGEPGIDGGLMARKMPGQPFMNYVSVANIDKALQKVTDAGGTIAMPKSEIGKDMGWIAAFQDTESNLMGLHQGPKGMTSGTKKAAKKKAPAKKAAKKAAKKKAAKKSAKKRR